MHVVGFDRGKPVLAMAEKFYCHPCHWNAVMLVTKKTQCICMGGMLCIVIRLYHTVNTVHINRLTTN